MTADFASNLNLMVALNNLTGGKYQYNYPTVTSTTGAVSPMNLPSIFQQAVAIANAANSSSYVSALGMDALNTSLSTPLWMQNMNNPLNFQMPKVDFTQAFKYNMPTATQNSSNPFAQTTAQQQNDNGVASGNTVVMTNGNAKFVYQLAAEQGYERTSADGIYKKGNNYYKYDKTNNSFVAATESEAASAKADDAKIVAGSDKINIYGYEVTLDEYAKNQGYEKTVTSGIYKKDGKYYRYNKPNNKFVETTGSQAQAAKADDTKKAKNAQAGANLAQKAFVAMKGAGTDHDTLKKVVFNEINKDNVIEMMDAWDKGFKDSMDGESFIESMQGEFHSGLFDDRQINHENKILDALVARAEKLGLNEEAATAKGIVTAEHKAFFGSSDKKVREAMETLVQQIRAKEAQNA